MTIYVLNFERAPGPSGDRGEMAMADGRCGAACALRSTTDTVPWSLCSYSPRSSWPQPLGGGGDATPCEDTREERGLFFNFLPPRVVTGWLSSVTRLAPGRAKSQVPQTHKDCCGFGGHGSAPGGALNQRGVSTRESSRCTGVASPRETESGADSRRRSKRAGTPRRATNPKTGGRPARGTAGTNPRTGPYGRCPLQLLF